MTKFCSVCGILVPDLQLPMPQTRCASCEPRQYVPVRYCSRCGHFVPCKCYPWCYQELERYIVCHVYPAYCYLPDTILFHFTLGLTLEHATTYYSDYLPFISLIDIVRAIFLHTLHRREHFQ